MMKASELVERLRARCSYGDARLWQKHDPLSEQAADIIESQAKAIEEMLSCLIALADDARSACNAAQHPALANALFDADQVISKAHASHSKEGGQG